MPATTAERSLGAELAFGDARGGPYSVVVARVRDFTVPSVTTELFEVSAHDNDSGFKEKVASLLHDMEDMTFDISYIHTDASHNVSTGLRYLSRYSVKKDWQITLNAEMGGGTVRFAGYVTKFDGPKLPVNGVATATITLTPTDYYDIAE